MRLTVGKRRRSSMAKFTLGQEVTFVANGRVLRGTVVAHVGPGETPEEAVARCKARPRPRLRPETVRGVARPEASYIVVVEGRRYAYFPPVKALMPVVNVPVQVPVPKGDRRGK